jgi:hypothetical protein
MLLMLLVIVFFTCAAAARAQSAANKPTPKVMTYNVDQGTDFAAITAVLTNPNATATDFQAAVTQTINEVGSTNPAVRMHLIASEIAQSQPDLVGLQEAAVWTFPTGQLDLLQIILADLAVLGQHYAPVVDRA